MAITYRLQSLTFTLHVGSLISPPPGYSRSMTPDTGSYPGQHFLARKINNASHGR